MERERVLRRSSSEGFAKALGVVPCLAVAELGYKGTEVGAIFGWTRSGTSKAVERGRRAQRDDSGLIAAILRGRPEQTGDRQTSKPDKVRR